MKKRQALKGVGFITAAASQSQAFESPDFESLRFDIRPSNRPHDSADATGEAEDDRRRQSVRDGSPGLKAMPRQSSAIDATMNS
jgi:hypothetical protein